MSSLMLCIALSFAIPVAIHTTPADAARDKAVYFMKRVSKEMIRAVQSGAKENLEKVIIRYADLQGIGTYSLGRYANKLPSNSRSNYYRGVAKFMARYLMEQSQRYDVTKAKVQSPSFKENGERIVDTIVYLKDGTQYEVQWRLKPHGSTFKIRDARLLGLWLVPYQRDLFSDFVNKQGGNVNALVIALHYN